MSRALVAAVVVLALVVGVLGGVLVVATQNGSTASPCYPLVRHSDWLLDHEAEC